MRVVVTGQVGMDKQSFLERACEIAKQAGREVKLYSVGERMYAEAPDVKPGRILDLPLSRLNTLRRSVFKDIIAESAALSNNVDIVINTHATFRWRHGLFYAFDYDLMKQFNADLYITLVDNVDRIHARLIRDGHTNHTLKDIMVWREEEILATELLSQIVRGYGCFYVLARGCDDDSTPAVMFARLISSVQWKKAYLSFPMSHVRDAQTLAEIERFRAEMKKHFICFDPGDIEEKRLGELALTAAEKGERFITISPLGQPLQIETTEALSIVGDIDGQIYARDFKLIDQSDMIISYIPTTGSDAQDGRPEISSGVERELQHAHEAAKEVFVIWPAKTPPSPFITETATRLFQSVEQAVTFFLDNNYIPTVEPGALFRE